MNPRFVSPFQTPISFLTPDDRMVVKAILTVSV